MHWADVFDTHSHIGFYRGAEYPHQAALQRMDRNDIRRAVICTFVSGLIDRQDFRRANDYVIAAVRTCPDRFVGLAAVSPAHGDFAVEEFRRGLDHGLSGVKLHSDKHGMYSLAGPATATLMREVESQGALTFIHSDFSSKTCSPYQIVELARAFPQAKILMGHFGLDQEQCGHAPVIAKDVPNLYLDTSQTVDNPEAVFINSTNQVGVERVLFGSDAPVISPEVNLKKLEVAVEVFGLAPDVARAIAWENAVRLLAGAPNVRV
jgi:predicted TIM-barrel fold metal-dependent hydrolase